jgi:hypothetical protein
MRGRREGRVSTDTHGPRAMKKARGRNHRFSRIIRHSLRDGFNAYSALPGNRAFLLPSHADRSAHLTPASGCQDQTTSASMLASLVRRGQHVHRIPASRVVTIAIRPLHRGGMAPDNHIFPKNGRSIFFERGLDSRISIESAREIRFSRARFLMRHERLLSERRRHIELIRPAHGDVPGKLCSTRSCISVGVRLTAPGSRGNSQT